jgi:CRP-like cAMP-binding protein
MNGMELAALSQLHGTPRREPRTNDWANVLAGFPIFAGVRKRRLRKLTRNATTAEFAPGETIIHAGERSDALYVILGGHATAVSKHAARTLHTGDYFGELALIDGHPRSATVFATSEAHVMKLPSRSLLNLARREPALTLTMLKNLTRQLRHLETHRAQMA